jgi:hypothetical protein
VEPSRKSVTFACESISIKGGSHPKHVIINNKLFNGAGKAEASKKLKPSFTVGHRAQAAPTTVKMASSTDAPRRSSQVENQEVVSSDKPSGLRMPSPKLGFFDAVRGFIFSIHDLNNIRNLLDTLDLTVQSIFSCRVE